MQENALSKFKLVFYVRRADNDGDHLDHYAKSDWQKINFETAIPELDNRITSLPEATDEEKDLLQRAKYIGKRNEIITAMSIVIARHAMKFADETEAK